LLQRTALVRRALIVFLIPSILPLLYCRPAGALVGADVADRTVQRYTVVVAAAKSRCSGVVLVQDIVLTAAHCVQGASNLQVGGSAGIGRQATPPSTLTPVLTIVQHPLYKPGDTGSPDLAILKLAKPLPDRFIPAVINPRTLNEGEDLIAAGFGQTSAKDTSAGTVLRMVLMRVAQRTRNWVMLVRVGEDDTRGGHGDSGGPIFAYRGMHSLVALIVGGTDDKTMAVALSAHYGWIRETMEKMTTP
jgi:secreted trypsin-like serine protease